MTGRSRLALALILTAALFANVALVLHTRSYQPVWDSADYVRHAVSIAHGDGYPDSRVTASPSQTAFRPPAYPYLLGAVFAVSGDSFTAGRLLTALLDVAIVLLIFLIARELWDVRHGLAAAAAAAVFPAFFLLSGALNTESLFVVIELGAVLLALRSRARGGDLRLAAGAGALCGLATLTRSNGLLLVIPIALGVWVLRPRFSRPALMAPAVAVLFAALTAAPWAVRNTLTFDRVMGVNGQSGIALAGIYNEAAQDHGGYRASWVQPSSVPRYEPVYRRRDLNEAELDSHLRHQALDWAVHRPGYMAESTWLNGLRMFGLARDYPGLVQANRDQLGFSANAAHIEAASFYLLALLALAGVLTTRRWPRERRIPGFVWLVPVLLVLAAAPILGLTRYRVPLYPFLLLAAAPAIVACADRLRSPRRLEVAA